MNLQDVKRKSTDEKKETQVNIRASKAQKKWLEKNDLSVTKIFEQAIKELGFKEVKE